MAAELNKSYFTSSWFWSDRPAPGRGHMPISPGFGTREEAEDWMEERQRGLGQAIPAAAPAR